VSEELAIFDRVMDELRKAYKAANGRTDVQAEIQSKFDTVVQQKDRYLLGTLNEKAAALNKLSLLIEQAVRVIAQHLANFPLGTLKGVLNGFGGATDEDDETDGNKNSNAGAGDNPAAGGSSLGGTSSTDSGGGASQQIQIVIGPTELDALSRVAQSEVGHFGKYGQDQLSGGLAAVVDTIINRVAHASFPDSIEAVINQPFQFSAINTLGSWKSLPAARAEIANIVVEHLKDRASRLSSAIKGATHFLNPFHSSANALESWGNFVVANAVAVYGNSNKKDVHYHGFAPGTSLPKAYSIVVSGQTATFSGNGVSAIASEDGAGMARRIVEICNQEWERFGNGSKSETDDPQYLRVGDYWNILGIPYTGRTLVHNKATGKQQNPPWSSAFISFVLKEAGAGDGFKYAQAHCHYVQDYVKGRNGGVYEAMHPDFYIPKPGDILHYGRLGAELYDFAEAQAAYQMDSFYSSHSDIVIEIDQTAAALHTIGGNVSNSVGRKTIAIAENGKLLPRTDGQNSFPWIAILRLTQ
jgi:hypothetical protein